MIDKEKLRGSDLISGGIFLLLGIIIVCLALQMPLSDSFGGVQSQWYVSPALLPIFIGICMILISIGIIVTGFKEDGVKKLKAGIQEKKNEPILSPKNMRMAGVILPLCTIVYIDLKAFDFYLSVAIYLVFTTSVFYFEDDEFLKKSVFYFLGTALLVLILNATKLTATLNKVFFASMDIIGLLILLLFTFRAVSFAKSCGNPVTKKRLKAVLLVSFLVPLIVIPLFRFALRVPMPKEGVLINLMSRLYYALR